MENVMKKILVVLLLLPTCFAAADGGEACLIAETGQTGSFTRSADGKSVHIAYPGLQLAGGTFSLGFGGRYARDARDAAAGFCEIYGRDWSLLTYSTHNRDVRYPTVRLDGEGRILETFRSEFFIDQLTCVNN